MPWHSSLNRLRDALAELYPDMADARRVAVGASLSISAVVLHGTGRNIWQSVLEEAVKQDCVEAIIETAVAEYGKNRALVAALRAYRQSVVGLPSSTRTASNSPAADPLMLDLGDSVIVQLVQVPAGEFLMGSVDTEDGVAHSREEPQHRLWLQEYLVGKYPVTVAQFRMFVHASHYPSDPNSTQAPSNRPVGLVTWHEAMAFCDWASRVSARTVRLPSEAEWEKAARSTDGRKYPWGNRWDPGRCNTKERGPDHVTPVGYYSPLGDSPYGCADMGGNVFEWTRSLWGMCLQEPDFMYPYDPSDGRENTDAGDDMRRVVRGGSFIDGYWAELVIRSAFRDGGFPTNRHSSLGFRVVVVPVSH